MLQRMVLGLLGALALFGSGCTLEPQSGDSTSGAATETEDRSEPTRTAHAAKTKQVTVAVSGMH